MAITLEMTAKDKVSAPADKAKRAADRLVGPFGKASKAVKALGIAGIAAGAGLGVMFIAVRKLTAILRPMIEAAAFAETNVTKLEQVIKSTGSAAGLTTAEIISMSEALQDVTGVSDDLIQEVSGIALSFTKIGKDIFPEVIERVLDLSVFIQTDLKSAVIQLGKAINDPIEGITALSRSGITFNRQQKDLIRSLVESNRLFEAQAIMLRELNIQFGGQARAAMDTFAGQTLATKNRIDDLRQAIGELITPTLTDLQTNLQPVIRMMTDLVDLLNVPQVKQAGRSAFLDTLSVMEALGFLQPGTRQTADLLGLVLRHLEKIGPVAGVVGVALRALKASFEDLNDEQLISLIGPKVAPALLRPEPALIAVTREFTLNQQIPLLQQQAQIQKAINTLLVQQGELSPVDALHAEFDLERDILGAKEAKLKLLRAEANAQGDIQKSIALGFELQRLQDAGFGLNQLEGLKRAGLDTGGDKTFFGGVSEGVASVREQFTPHNLGLSAVQSAASATSLAFDNLFRGLIDGSQSAADAFKSFATQIVNEITVIIAKLIALYLVQQLTNTFFPGAGTAAGAFDPNVFLGPSRATAGGGGAPAPRVGLAAAPVPAPAPIVHITNIVDSDDTGFRGLRRNGAFRREIINIINEVNQDRGR